MAEKRDFATRLVHAGSSPEAHDGALSVPISQASVFGFPSAEIASEIHEGERPGYFYGRMGTPTQAALESTMAELEGGEAALATASGMAAISLSLLACLEPGDHLVVQDALYTTTTALIDDFLGSVGIEVSRFDGSSLESLNGALRSKTRAVFLETPSNPALLVTDIGGVAERARAVGAAVLVDSTFATPVNQRPLELGADLVIHSATKYLGGHGDLVAGILVGKGELVERARWRMMRLLGPAIAPFNAWLVLRGLKTLAVRIERQNATALEVARFLADRPEVAAVHYPGLASHPQHELAARQMSGFGGVVSFEVADAATARAVVDRVELCVRAVSLGDVATLIQHSGSLTQASLSSADRARAGVSDGLIRLSLGLEAPRDVISDLAQALEGGRER